MRISRDWWDAMRVVLGVETRGEQEIRETEEYCAPEMGPEEVAYLLSLGGRGMMRMLAIATRDEKNTLARMAGVLILRERDRARHADTLYPRRAPAVILQSYEKDAIRAAEIRGARWAWEDAAPLNTTEGCAEETVNKRHPEDL